LNRKTEGFNHKLKKGGKGGGESQQERETEVGTHPLEVIKKSKGQVEGKFGKHQQVVKTK